MLAQVKLCFPVLVSEPRLSRPISATTMDESPLIESSSKVPGAWSDSDCEAQTFVQDSAKRQKRASTSLNDDRSSWMCCSICSFNFPVCHMVNRGTSECPRWVDKGCHTTSRWYDKALTSHGVVPGDQKKFEPLRYNKQVQRFRVDQPYDPLEVKKAGQLIHARERRTLSWTFCEEESHSQSTAAVEKITFFTKRFWIGHHVVFGMYTREEATALWYSAEKPDSGVARRQNKHNELTLAIDMGVDIIKSNKHGKKRKLQTEEELSDNDAAEDFLKEKGSV